MGIRYKQILDVTFSYVRARKQEMQDKRDIRSEAYADVMQMIWQLTDKEKERVQKEAMGIRTEDQK